MPWIIDRAISCASADKFWVGGGGGMGVGVLVEAEAGHLILKNTSANATTPLQLHLCSLWGYCELLFSLSRPTQCHHLFPPIQGFEELLWPR